ncbi:MAG: oligosaccharide flippase family protein [Bacteroidota bacterium]|nr:oligosaccharide flippase family protein [Bacteroidota bacterium]
MKKQTKTALIVFPDEWLQYSPSVLNMYKCLSEKYDTKIIYVDNERFNNKNLVSHYKRITIWKITAYLSRKTFGYKLYKTIRLFFTLFFTKLFDKKYDLVIAIDSSGFLVTRFFYKKTIYFSLETEKDNYFRLSQWIGIERLIIQSEERKRFLIGDSDDTQVFYIQNAPILSKTKSILNQNKIKRILYMGNIDYGYGLEQFIDCISGLSNEYVLVLKGIRNEKFYNHLKNKYNNLLQANKIVFDFDYVPQEKIIEYASRYYIGITGYDIELAKKSFNYFSSPAGKLFNYYAAGIPVIGIDIIGLKSIKDFKAGVLLEEVSPENIKNAILTIEKEYVSFCNNSLKASLEFDFKKSFDYFINSIESLEINSEKKDNSLKSFVTKGHERSVKTKKNIITSIFIKCISISISFLLIPLALNYLNPIKYGIWLTLTSIIGWVAFFDLGLGNGLRNKLAEALAKDNKVLARTYISTSYAIMTFVIGIVYTVFVIVFPYVNWTYILNTPQEMNEEINKLIFIVFSFFCLQFIIKLISMILNADQRSAISGGINTFASLLSLIIVFVLTKTTNGSLLWLSIGVSTANLISPLIATIWFFKTDYKHLTPSLKYVKLSSAKDLMGLGFMFFIMQFAALILFSTDSYIIDQLYGPEEVTPYNIAFKYFSIVTMGFAIITTPFWTAYTDAYHKKDFNWIKRTTNKLISFWLILACGVVLMLVFSKFFYKVWIGSKIEIPFILSATMACWVLIATWTSVFGNFLSGVEKIRLSIYHSLIMIIVNIPLTIFLAKYLNLGSAGVMIGTCICVLPQVFLHPIQYKKIITNTAKGIWNK